MKNRMQEYLSKKELCEYLGAGERTINDWMKNQALPHYRVGKKFLRFKVSEVNEWIAQFRKTATNQVDEIVDDILAHLAQAGGVRKRRKAGDKR